MSDAEGPRLCVVFFKPSARAESPVEKEYREAVRQPKERAKIDALLRRLAQFGLGTQGILVEKVKASTTSLYELKIKAFGSEHRFLAGYAPLRTREGLPILVLAKYLKKKKWRLDRADIETAASRLSRLGPEER